MENEVASVGQMNSGLLSMEDVIDVRINEKFLQIQVSRYRSQEFGNNGQAKGEKLELPTGFLRANQRYCQ